MERVQANEVIRRAMIVFVDTDTSEGVIEPVAVPRGQTVSEITRALVAEFSATQPTLVYVASISIDEKIEVLITAQILAAATGLK